MLPPAPALLSITNGAPSLVCRCVERMRAVRSAEPPGPNGTTRVTVRCGQLSCACAVAETTSITATASIFRITDLLRVRANDTNNLYALRQLRLAAAFTSP